MADQAELRARLDRLEARLAELDRTAADLRREADALREAVGTTGAAGGTAPPPAARAVKAGSAVAAGADWAPNRRARKQPAAPASGPTAAVLAARRRVMIMAAVGVIAAGLVTGVVFLFVGKLGEHVHGWAALEGGLSGESWRGKVSDCDSGMAYVPRFFGAHLMVGGHTLRIEDTGEAATVSLKTSARGYTDVARTTCQEWDVLVKWAHVKKNSVSAVDGHLRIDCPLPNDAGRLKADVTFENCAQ